MFTNVFSNFNTLIDAFDASKAKDAPFGTRKVSSMLKSIERFINDDCAPSSSVVSSLALSLYNLLEEDHWSLTDRDLFGFISDATEISYRPISDYQVFERLVRKLTYLPLDVEGNGTLARRYKEVLCSVSEDPYKHLYFVGAATAVLMYLVVRIASEKHSAQVWLHHHWRALKNSHNATLDISLLKHSSADYSAASKGTCAQRARILAKWTAETLACVYSRIYVPAVLEKYGNIPYRNAYAAYIARADHEDN